jgi:hypothetical protein
MPEPQASNVRLIGLPSAPSRAMSKQARRPLFPVPPSAVERSVEENVALLGTVSHVVQVEGQYALVHASPIGLARIGAELQLPVFQAERGVEYFAVRVGARALAPVPAIDVSRLAPPPPPSAPRVSVRPTSTVGTSQNLEIKGTDYRVTETAPKRRNIDVRRFEVRKLDGSLDKPYVVSFQDDHGHSAQCSCPDWIYRRRNCKHIQGIKAAFGEVQTALAV